MIRLKDGTTKPVGEWLKEQDPVICKPVNDAWEDKQKTEDVVRAYLEREIPDEKPVREVVVEVLPKRDKVAPPNEKKCRECGEVKPLSEFYSNGMGGTQNTCQACARERQKIYNKKNKKYMENKATETTKKCARCGRILSLENFSKHNRAKDGLFPICKTCVKENCAEGRAKKRAERETAEAKPTSPQPTEARPEFKLLGVEAPQVERRPKVEPFLAPIAHKDTYKDIESGEFLQNIPDDMLYIELTRRGFRGAMIKVMAN